MCVLPKPPLVMIFILACIKEGLRNYRLYESCGWDAGEFKYWDKEDRTRDVVSTLMETEEFKNFVIQLETEYDREITTSPDSYVSSQTGCHVASIGVSVKMEKSTVDYYLRKLTSCFCIPSMCPVPDRTHGSTSQYQVLDNKD